MPGSYTASFPFDDDDDVIACQLVVDHDLPFGGYRQSGWGHEFGREAYVKTKSVWTQL